VVESHFCFYFSQIISAFSYLQNLNYLTKYEKGGEGEEWGREREGGVRVDRVAKV
jgi:hypothetical protein